MYNSFDNAPLSRANGGHYKQLCFKIFHIFSLPSIFPTIRPISALFFRLPYKSKVCNRANTKVLVPLQDSS